MLKVTFEDVTAIAIGAGILGTGGGGNPYLESVHLQRTIRRLGAVPVIPPEALDDDACVALVGYIGAPTASIEKLPEGRELLRAIRLLEEHLGRRLDALGIAEIGGANSMGPLIAGLQAELPVVDGDGMGRAFPELQMTSYMFHDGVTVTPLAMVDAGESSAVIPRTAGALWAERLARNLATSMGATAGLAGFVMSGAQVKAYGIHYTLSLAKRLGERVLRARAAGEEVPAVIAASLHGRLLLRGKIIDLFRRTTRGFARGSLVIEGFGRKAERLNIEFQNEFLIATSGGRVLASVPDLICIVTEESGEPVTTEVLRYGTRVAVLGVPAAAALKTPRALAVVGPRAFGYQIDFQPLPDRSVIGVKAATDQQERSP